MPPPPHHSRLIQGSSSSNTESVDGAANLFEESALPSSFSARRRRNLLRFGLAANGLDLVPPPPLLQRPRRPPRGGARIALRDSCVLCGYCRGRDWALFGELLLFRLSYRAAEQRSAWSELLAALVGGGVPPANSAAVCARHFLGGRPDWRPAHPDYLPTAEFRWMPPGGAAVEDAISRLDPCKDEEVWQFCFEWSQSSCLSWQSIITSF